MGIDVSAKVFLGLPHDELHESVDLGPDDDFMEWAEENGVDNCSPYFDAPTDELLFGFDIARAGRYQASRFPWDRTKVEELTAKFKDLFGKEPQLYISPHVT